MGVGISFTAVSKDGLKYAPEDIQKFVKEFFKEMTIFGIPCYVGVGSNLKSPWEHVDDGELFSQSRGEKDYVLNWMKNNPAVAFDYNWS